uniref:Uncharacterized protein n=1 Tax=Megaselia scalaris TaxID=36166 RepID=T1GFA9_MEGSC
MSLVEMWNEAFHYNDLEINMRLVEYLKRKAKEAAEEQIISFANKVANMVTFLQSCGSEHHLQNSMFLEELIGKIPSSKKFEWAHYSYSLSR